MQFPRGPFQRAWHLRDNSHVDINSPYVSMCYSTTDGASVTGEGGGG